MDNLDFGILTIVVLIFPILLDGIPKAIIVVGGVLALRKGYPKSGGVLIGAAVINLILIVLGVIIPHWWGPSTYGELYPYMKIAALLASCLTAGGVVGLVRSIPRMKR